MANDGLAKGIICIYNCWCIPSFPTPNFIIAVKSLHYLRDFQQTLSQSFEPALPKNRNSAGHIHALPNLCYSFSCSFSCCERSGTVNSEVSIIISSAGFKSSVKSYCRPTLVTSILFTHVPIHGNCLLNSSIKSYISAVVSLSSNM